MIAYAMLYAALLGAPWLTRSKGHVMVESFIMLLPGSARLKIEQFVYLVSAIICVIIGWFGMSEAIDSFRSGEEEMRSITIGRGWLFVGFPVAFWLTAIEFLRFLFGRDSMYADRNATEGL